MGSPMSQVTTLRVINSDTGFPDVANHTSSCPARCHAPTGARDLALVVCHHQCADIVDLQLGDPLAQWHRGK